MMRLRSLALAMSYVKTVRSRSRSPAVRPEGVLCRKRTLASFQQLVREDRVHLGALPEKCLDQIRPQVSLSDDPPAALRKS